MNIELLRTLQARIFDQLEAGYPNEAGGFLLGKLRGDTIIIDDVVPIENVFAAEEQHHRYTMTPQDWMRLEDEAEARGLSLVGYYHSHPDSPAFPSEFDRDRAMPNFAYLITSVMRGRATEMRGWRLVTDHSRFESEPILLREF